jgi:MoxR-like ATPase
MTPSELRGFLNALVGHPVRNAAMIWGPPGVGKSSIVAQVAVENDLRFVDVRLSQLAPTDLRGLPVAVEGTSTWFPPEFLPRDGAGILFLDELNMAAPTMQGVAQQLVLDRRVGSYVLPDGWFVWAAGNRKQDRASVFEMPAPLANRFLHVDIEPDLDDFRRYGHARGIHERILAFLAFRPELLHALDAKHPSWPSPRSWEMANTLLAAGLPVGPAVGESAENEFNAFADVYALLPVMDRILEGTAIDEDRWPDEPSARYALVLGLAQRAEQPESAMSGFRWLADRAAPEWVQLYADDIASRMRAKDRLGMLAAISKDEPRFVEFVKAYASLTGHGPVADVG